MKTHIWRLQMGISSAVHINRLTGITVLRNYTEATEISPMDVFHLPHFRAVKLLSPTCLPIFPSIRLAILFTSVGKTLWAG